jgi:hypothetical protein
MASTRRTGVVAGSLGSARCPMTSPGGDAGNRTRVEWLQAPCLKHSATPSAPSGAYVARGQAAPQSLGGTATCPFVLGLPAAVPRWAQWGPWRRLVLPGPIVMQGDGVRLDWRPTRRRAAPPRDPTRHSGSTAQRSGGRSLAPSGAFWPSDVATNVASAFSGPSPRQESTVRHATARNVTPWTVEHL